MVTLNASSLASIVNDSTLSSSMAEAIIDQAINRLNLYRCSISNLSGTAGNKTGTYSSAEAGAILSVAQRIHMINYVPRNSSQPPNINTVDLKRPDDKTLQIVNIKYPQPVTADDGAAEAARVLIGRTILRT